MLIQRVDVQPCSMPKEDLEWRFALADCLRQTWRPRRPVSR